MGHAAPRRPAPSADISPLIRQSVTLGSTGVPWPSFVAVPHRNPTPTGTFERNERAMTFRLGAQSAPLLLIFALLGVFAVTLPAYAAPPANDQITAPRDVTTIPSRFAQNTAEATSSRADGECVAGASVWYRYRPTTTSTVRVVTKGSEFDTVVAVFRGRRSDRTLLECNDDAFQDLDAAAQHRFRSGRRYWIAVSACCAQAARGGPAVLTLYRPRSAAVTMTVDRVETGRISGRLFVEGTVRCNTPSDVSFEVNASQRVGTDGVASGTGGGLNDYCRRRASHWVVPIDSSTGRAFQPGTVALTIGTFSTDGFATTNERTTLNATVTTNPNTRFPSH